MFSDIDEALRQMLQTGMPIRANEIDISFERPTREWSSKLSRPAINLFLYDIRERPELRNEVPQYTRIPGQSMAGRRRPLRRLDLAYLCTAWAREPGDEHRILASLLSCLYRSVEVPSEFLSQVVLDTGVHVPVRIADPDYLAKPADFWGVMDNDLHASVIFVATVPLDPFEPTPTPLVSSATFRLGIEHQPPANQFQLVGGTVHAPGHPEQVLAGATVSLEGTALQSVTGEDGRYLLGNVPEGTHILRVTDSAGLARTHQIVVPSPSFDIAFGAE